MKLVIIGDGNERQKLESLVSGLPCNKNIFFLGELNRKRTLEYMFISDIITSFYEVSNVGNVLLEGLSMGKVVIARNNGNTSSIIKSGINGFLVEDSPSLLIQEFSNIMLNVIKYQNLRKSIEKNAFQWAKKNLMSWEDRLRQEYQWIMRNI